MQCLHTSACSIYMLYTTLNIFLLTWFRNLLTAVKQRQDSAIFFGFLLGCRAALPLLIGRSANCGTAKAILMSCYAGYISPCQPSHRLPHALPFRVLGEVEERKGSEGRRYYLMIQLPRKLN